MLQKWIKKDGFPEDYVTDNGREFTSNEFENWCSRNSIKHRKVGLEAQGAMEESRDVSGLYEKQ